MRGRGSTRLGLGMASIEAVAPLFPKASHRRERPLQGGPRSRRARAGHAGLVNVRGEMR